MSCEFDLGIKTQIIKLGNRYFNILNLDLLMELFIIFLSLNSIFLKIVLPKFLFFSLFFSYIVHLYTGLPSLHLGPPHLLSLPIHSPSISLQKWAGLPGILTKHGITRFAKTRHKPPVGRKGSQDIKAGPHLAYSKIFCLNWWFPQKIYQQHLHLICCFKWNSKSQNSSLNHFLIEDNLIKVIKISLNPVSLCC